ncbi:hypothetical protein V6N11_068786 [Hibiscus sabdariffa]|uniref:X8 domain-containing protein n=1 Tax=Hibiscus sabdariffa TaxID=183260 RepID=A0ABR2PB40_9ROSI
MANGQPSSEQATLLANINFACSQVDCRVMQKGCPCFRPDNLMSHASIAMNLYYQAKGRNQWNCDFRGSALVVITNPRLSIQRNHNAWQIHTLSISNAEKLTFLKLHDFSELHAKPPVLHNTEIHKSDKALKANRLESAIWMPL